MPAHQQKRTARKRVSSFASITPVVEPVPPPAWSISPSRWDWQVMLYNTARSHPIEMQFFHTKYSLAAIIQRANFEADWYKRNRFLVRDPAGVVVHNGPVCDALGNPKGPHQ